ncbi:Phosphoglycerate kinase [Geodia barretti]|uniref:Phosphoglycerate kinase n=2 Tax=Geodia barretti TaxID=519541 RepID=A0AA35TYG5_GEOBA|nr:Phosphoglycerate kinase [Geodia barretti]
MAPGDVVLLENLRFDAGEEANDPGFAQSLAALTDYFVMDAFAVAHRAHASTVGVTEYLPSAMGFLVEREVTSMGRALESPEKPLAALMGGAKVSDKILLLDNIMDKLDHLFIGGGMCVTFLKAQGHGVGASQFAREMLGEAEKRGIKVHLPSEVVVASEFAADPAEVQVSSADGVPEGGIIMDIAPSAAQQFASELQQCRTVIWNGPMGVFEMPRFSEGTRVVAEAIAGAPGVTSVVGGGSTAETVEALGLMDSMTHVSTGGGASLEFLGGIELPGIAALPDAD